MEKFTDREKIQRREAFKIPIHHGDFFVLSVLGVSKLLSHFLRCNYFLNLGCVAYKTNKISTTPIENQTDDPSFTLFKKNFQI